MESPHCIWPRSTSVLLEEPRHQSRETLCSLLTRHGDGWGRQVGMGTRTHTHLTHTHLLPSGRHSTLHVGVGVGGGKGVHRHIRGWMLGQAHTRVERLWVVGGREGPGGHCRVWGGANACPSPMDGPLSSVTHDRQALDGSSGHAVSDLLVLLLLLLQVNVPLCLLLGDLTGQTQRRQHLLVQWVVWRCVAGAGAWCGTLSQAGHVW